MTWQERSRSVKRVSMKTDNNISSLGSRFAKRLNAENLLRSSKQSTPITLYSHRSEFQIHLPLRRGALGVSDLGISNLERIGTAPRISARQQRVAIFFKFLKNSWTGPRALNMRKINSGLKLLQWELASSPAIFPPGPNSLPPGCHRYLHCAIRVLLTSSVACN
jgi:hypothetical protein